VIGRALLTSGAVVVLTAAVLATVIWRVDSTRTDTGAEQPQLLEVAASVPAGGPPVEAVAAAPVVPTTAPVLTAAVVAGPIAECPTTTHGAIVDRATQRAWLCGDGAVVAAMPITSAWSMPDPDTYPVYAKDLAATSTMGGHDSRMTHFVAFSYGERTGARVAFHSVPTSPDGTFVQPLDTVGQLGVRGETSGCIRVLPEDAARIWDWLAVGDEVHVIS